MKQLILLAAIFLMSVTGFAEQRVVSVGKEILQTSLFNYPALQELSHHSDQVWNQIVREKGSVAAAKASLQDPKKLDPRIVEIYTSLSQLIESSRFDDESIRALYGNTIRGPVYQGVTGEKFSPLLRHVARSLATGLAAVMFEKMDSAWTFVPTYILVGDLIECAIQNCDQSKYTSMNPQYRRPHFSEDMLRYGKIYFYADALAVSDFTEDLKCDLILDPSWQYATAEVLSQIQFKNAKTLNEVVFVANCDRPTSEDFSNWNSYQERKHNMKALALKVAKAYVKKAL